MRAAAALLLGTASVALWAAPVRAAEDGPWVWPVVGAPVARAFDPPTIRYGPGHRGADLAAPAGSVVRAAGAGRVSYAGLLAGRGVVVVVHGSLRTTYEPVTPVVRVGQQVDAGAPLGRLAPGGHCAAGCLHWGLLRGQVYLDPVRLVRRGPSRLLPLDAPGASSALPPGPGSAAPALPPAAVQPAPAQPGPVQPGPVQPGPVQEPRLSLRADALAPGATALVALLAGLALLRRAPRPRRPPEAAALHVQPPVDLAAERDRRRAG